MRRISMFVKDNIIGMVLFTVATGLFVNHFPDIYRWIAGVVPPVVHPSRPIPNSGETNLCQSGIPDNFDAPANAVSEGSCIALCDGILLTLTAVYVDEDGNAGNRVAIAWNGGPPDNTTLATNTPAVRLRDDCEVRLVETGDGLDRRYAVFQQSTVR